MTRPFGSYVKNREDGKTLEVKITEGLVGQEFVEVTAGLNEGDKVVLPLGAQVPLENNFIITEGLTPIAKKYCLETFARRWNNAGRKTFMRDTS